MPILIAGFVGAVVGSFLNVCIFRMPEGESVVFPASHCRYCKTAIAWHDNIPLVSFIVLKGRCRNCGAGISWQYIFVESLTIFLFILFYEVFGLSVKGGVYLVLSLALLVESAIDYRHKIIPDSITLPGIALGVVLSGFFPGLHEQDSWLYGILYSVLGVLLGGGILYLTGSVGEWILKKEAMGGGDVKLLAMIGAVLGWRGALWTIFVSSLIGSVVGVYLRLKNGEKEIPFGPYLALGAFFYLFFGQRTIEWYAKFLGWG